jgi:hypothetical protein
LPTARSAATCDSANGTRCISFRSRPIVSNGISDVFESGVLDGGIHSRFSFERAIEVVLDRFLRSRRFPRILIMVVATSAFSVRKPSGK